MVSNKNYDSNRQQVFGNGRSLVTEDSESHAGSSNPVSQISVRTETKLPEGTLGSAPSNGSKRTITGEKEGSGLGHWMERVLRECDKVGSDLEADPVHDLRVALRRCRSMADGWMLIDPDPAWKQMKKAGKKLFQALGELRDSQVMIEWVEKLASPEDPVGGALAAHAARCQAELKQAALAALDEFDRKRWQRWSTTLPRRTARVKPGSVVFQHMALERWTEAHRLHGRALRNRSSVALHQLRIGIKRLRYTVENFLPELHDAWIHDLKDLQDQLGEVHDFDVLWATAVRIHAFSDIGERKRWQTILREQRQRRIEKYRRKMVGRDSLWRVWRGALPSGPEVKAAGLARLKLWASFLDPDFRRSQNITALALQLYDDLEANGLLRKNRTGDLRSILQIAGIAHDVGRSKREQKHQKKGARLLEKMHVPLGWELKDVQLAAIVTRFHRGGVPTGGHKSFAKLQVAQQKKARLLAGILRLAAALDREHDHLVKRVKVELGSECVSLVADGYSEEANGERVAQARYLLESVLGKPILVRAREVAAR